MKIAILCLHLRFPEKQSLKAKRRGLKPLVHRLQKEFKVSAAEVDYMDSWKESLVACALVSNEKKHAMRVIQKIGPWLEKYMPDIQQISEKIEIIE